MFEFLNFLKFFFPEKEREKDKIKLEKTLENAEKLGFISTKEKLELEIERAKEKLKQLPKKRK